MSETGSTTSEKSTRELVEGLRVTYDDHVVVITLDRPASLNAMTREMVAAMDALLDELEGDFPNKRVIIVTGVGRGFCAGTDMKAVAATVAAGEHTKTRRADGTRARNIGDVAARLFDMPQPVIAAVNGIAVGAGFAMVLASDLRIASKSARFTGIFINRSMPPDGGSSYTLASLVGPAVAAEVLYTGRIYDVEWAQNVGLVSTVVEDDELLDAAMTLAHEIAAKPPIALCHTKELLHRNAPSLPEVVEREIAVNDLLVHTEDRVEAITAYSEKRAAVYHGR